MNNELESVKVILDEDEEILESFKPNRKRFTTITIISSTFMLLFFFSFPIIFSVLMLTNVIDTGGELTPAFMLLGFAAFPLAFMLINIFGNIARYKKTLYVVTNKRFIIRSGFIGVDYKSLTFDSVGYIDVRVDFLDKLVHPNTGSIQFGSSSVPVVTTQNGQQVHQFIFAHIDNPYDVYKRIKSYKDNKGRKEF